PYSTNVTGASAGPCTWSLSSTGTVRIAIMLVAMCHLLFLQIFQSVENAVGAWIYSDRRNETPGDRALAVDNEERSFTNAFAFAVYTKLSSHFAFRFEIREQ